MVRQQTQKGGAFVLVLVILTLAISGVLGFIFWQNYTSQDTNSNNVEASNLQAPTEDPKDDDEVDAPDTEGMETFTSPLSGYTVQYPVDWVVVSEGEKSENNVGGVSSHFNLTNVKRTGSYDGSDANTYLCLQFYETSRTGWIKHPQTANDKLLEKVGSVSPNDTTTLDINLRYFSVFEESSDMTASSINVQSASSRYFPIDDDYELRITASFNCVQGDYNALKNSDEKFIDRPEVAEAVEIIKTLRY